MKTHEQELFDRLNTSKASKPTVATEGSEVEEELKRDNPDFGTPLTIRNLFTHHDAHPLVIDFALLKTFGPGVFDWDSLTIFAEVQRKFSTQISEHARSKIQCIQTLHLNTLTWESWQVFEKVVSGLNNNVPRFDLMQVPTLEQLYAGIDILEHIRQEEFSQEVKNYMAAVVLNEDVFYVPPPLDFIQVEVARPYYVCRDCGNQDSAMFHDGYCDVCIGRFDPENGLSFRPDPELIAQGRGKNVDYLVLYNPDPIEARWNEVRMSSTRGLDLQENQVDIQVAKLLIARDYMNVRRKQLAEQLISLKSWLVSS